MSGNILDFKSYKKNRDREKAFALIQKNPDTDQSLTFYRDLIYQEPNEIGHYFNLAQIYFQKKDLPSSLLVLKKASSHFGPSVALYSRILEVHLSLENPGRLRSFLKKFIKIFPGEYLPRYRLAEVFFQDQRFKSSLRTLNSILKLHIAENSEIYLLMGQCLRNLGKYKQAINYYKKGKSWGVPDPIFDFNIGLCFKELGRIDEAAGTFRRGLKIPGANPLYFHFQLGSLYFSNEHYPKAIKSFKTALNYSPGEEAALHFLGICYNNTQNHLKAVEVFQKLKEVNPDNFSVYNNLGNSYYFLKEYRLSIASFQKSLELNPQNETVHNNLGNLYCECGEFETGIRYLKRALEINPDYPLALSNLANAYKATGDYPNAEKFILNLMKIDKKSPGNYFQWGYILFSQKRHKEALSVLKTGLSLDPLYFESLQLAGAVSFALGEYHGAVSYYKGALAVYPENQDVAFNLGMTYIRLGKFQEALNELLVLEQIFPAKEVLNKFLGLCFFELKDFSSALIRLKSFLDLDDPLSGGEKCDLFIYEILFEITFQRGEFEQANRVLNSWWGSGSLSLMKYWSHKCFMGLNRLFPRKKREF